MMRAMFWFDLFVLCYHLIAVDSLAQKINGGDVNVQQETSWQQGREQITKLESWLALQRYSPVIGLKRRQEATFSLEQGLSNTKEETQDAVQIDNTGPNMISANFIEDCQPLPRLRARGGKEEQAPPPVPNLKCPLPAITGTNTPKSGQQQPSPPTTGDGGNEREDGQAPSGTKLEQQIILPDLFRIPMNDGDNPTCYDATYGLMPVGVCQNPQQTPQPSKYDVFMNRNIDVYARAWKLIDSQPAWPGMRECLPASQKDNGIWCCRFYSYLFLWADVCWPLVAIEHLNSRGIGHWQQHQFNNPLILPP